MQRNSDGVTPQGYRLMLAPVSPPSAAAAPSAGGSSRLYRAIRGLAATQIALMVAVTSWVIVLLIEDFIMGFWGLVVVGSIGAVVITTGSVGIAASKRKNNCLIITFMVLCIISAILLGSILIFFSWALAIDTVDYRQRLDYVDYTWYPDDIICDYNYYENGTAVLEASNRTYPCPMADWAPAPVTSVDDFEYHLVLAMYSLVLIFSVALLVVVVVASAFSCKAICNSSRHVQPGTHFAYVVPMAAGYQQTPGNLLVPIVGQAEPKKPRPVIVQPPDMYPINIPIEPMEVSPVHQGDPPSYSSLECGEEDATTRAARSIHVV